MTNNEKSNALNPLWDFARLCCCLALGVFLLDLIYGGQRTDFNNAALGTNNEETRGDIDGDQVHCADLRDIDRCIIPSNIRNLPSKVVWLGNSQLHAINQKKPGERTAPTLLAGALRAGEMDVLGFSQPNANFQEHLLLLGYLISKTDIDYLILPAVFDDTREEGVRPTLEDILQDELAAEFLRQTDTFHRLATEQKFGATGTEQAKQGRLQRETEDAIDDFLSANFTGWLARSEARGQIFLQLYQLRNFILRISPTSKRRKIPARYTDNMLAFDEMLGLAQSHGIKVLVYIVPLRNDVEPPYIQSEYSEFVAEVESFSTKHEAIFLNLEDLVPGHHWGLKASTTFGSKDALELDFMHFQGEGHILLADAIEAEIIRDITR